MLNGIHALREAIALLGLARWNWSVSWIVPGAALPVIFAPWLGMP